MYTLYSKHYFIRGLILKDKNKTEKYFFILLYHRLKKNRPHNISKTIKINYKYINIDRCIVSLTKVFGK